MTPTPNYHSHAEQVKALGCAANFDPKKHPRRAAQEKARKRFEREVKKPAVESKKGMQDAAKEARAEMAVLAKELSHLTMRDAAEVMEIPYWRIQKLKHEFDLEFADYVPNTREADICEAAKGCKSYREVESVTGLTYTYVLRVLNRHGIFFRASAQQQGTDNG